MILYSFLIQKATVAGEEKSGQSGETAWGIAVVSMDKEWGLSGPSSQG